MNLKDHDDYCNCEQALAYFHLLERVARLATFNEGDADQIAADIQAALDGMAAFDKAHDIDTDPTPWCTHCGPKSACDCTFAEND